MYYSRYSLIKSYDCRPSELAEYLADDCSDARDALDCSLYPEEIVVGGESWFFESSSCGQHDTRNEMEEFVNKEAYDMLIELWDKYHLEDANEEVNNKLESIRSLFAEVNEEQWIASYIEAHMEELE